MNKSINLGNVNINNHEFSVIRYNSDEKNDEDNIKLTSGMNFSVIMETYVFIGAATGVILANSQILRIESGKYQVCKSEKIILCKKSVNKKILIIEYCERNVFFNYNDKLLFCVKYDDFVQIYEDIILILNNMVGIEGFDVRTLDPIYLCERGIMFLNKIYDVKYEEVYLEDLLTRYVDEHGEFNDSGLINSHIYKKLKGIPVKGEFIQVNLLGESDEQRISEILKSIQQNGYPHNGSYIVLYNDELLIKDGRHRASCLLYLYGNIKIPVLKLYLKHLESDLPSNNTGPIIKIVRIILENNLRNRKIAIKGGGVHTVKLLKLIGHEFDIRCIVDRNKSQRFSFPYDVIADEDLIKYDVDTVIISSYLYRHEMKENIKKLNSEYFIFDIYDYLEEMDLNIEREFYNYDRNQIKWEKI